jgi:predicted ATPase/class 3 adenylate cyclase
MRKNSAKQYPSQDQAGRNYVYLMTDVVGSSLLWEQDRIGMDLCISALEGIVCDVVKEMGGDLFRARGEGDSHFVIFASAEAALLAAARIALRLRKESKLDRILLRTAVHAGEANYRSGDYYGPPVNRCARMRAAANPGQILVSEVVRLLTPASEAIGFKALGRHRLRDLAEPEELFQLVHSGLPVDFPRLQTLSSGVHNLPVFLTSFVGRAEDLSAVSGLVRDNRMTTITGPGGVGKTRLALLIAEVLAARYEGGVWFVDLTWTDSDQGVVPAFCAGLAPYSVTDERSLVESLSHQQALLVVDNCEHVHKECRRLLMRLLGACPRLRVLATSRKVLQMPGEQVHLLRSMAVPSDDQADYSANFDAMNLFFERSADRRFRHDREKASLAQTGALLRKLDGLPLAIEIAASRTDLLTVSEISDRLDEFLERELDDDQHKPYSRTLAATIEWSCDLLSPQARDLLTKLTIFPATWTLDAAREVCEHEEVRPEVFEGYIQELLSHSLIFPEVILEDHKRFCMLQTTAQVVHRNIRQMPQILVERFVRYFGIVSEGAKAMAAASKEARAFLAIECEYESLTRALDLSISSDSGEAMKIAENLRDYWLRSSRIRDGKCWFKRLSTASGLGKNDRIKALSGLSSFCLRLGELDEAKAALTAAEEAIRDEGGYEWARVLGNQATLWQSIGELDQARAAFTVCVDVFRTSGHPYEEALAMINLGVIKMRMGESLPECVALFWQAVKCAEKLGSASMQANAYSSLSWAHGLMGEDKQALEYCRTSLQFYQAGPWLVQTAWTFVNLAHLLNKVDSFRSSALVWHASIRLEQLAEAHFSERQRKILNELETSLKPRVGVEDWVSARTQCSAATTDELIVQALEAIGGVIGP